MSERRDDEGVDDDDGVERLDAPNQQVVREDGSGPADEGSGGAPAPPKPEPEPEPEPEPNDEPAPEA
jgi:hypothetical protein